MSQIDLARRMLQAGRRSDDLTFVHRTIDQVLPLLDRKQPAFRTEVKLPSLTRDQKALCRELRAGGLPVNEIARKLGTNIGRVSEAINNPDPDEDA